MQDSIKSGRFWAEYEGGKMQDNITEYTHCLRCGRKLKNPEAKKIGYGKVCYNKMKANHKRPLFKIER